MFTLQVNINKNSRGLEIPIKIGDVFGISSREIFWENGQFYLIMLRYGANRGFGARYLKKTESWM